MNQFLFLKALLGPEKRFESLKHKLFFWNDSAGTSCAAQVEY